MQQQEELRRTFDAMKSPNVLSDMEHMTQGMSTPGLGSILDFAKSPGFDSLQASLKKTASVLDACKPPREMENIGRMLARTAEIEWDRAARIPMVMPPITPPVMRVRDPEQQERVERLTEAVCEQTSVIVDLKVGQTNLEGAVRQVEKSATVESRRHRRESRRRDEETIRIQWWLVTVATVVGTITGAVAMKFLGL